MGHQFALVGCGGMGRRHLRGFVELARVRPGLVELAAVVDVDRERAEFVAGEVEEFLGNRAAACTSIAEAKAQRPELVAADIVTTAGTHHVAAVEALDAGLHVLVEKPLAVTMRGCARIRAAAVALRAPGLGRGELSARPDPPARARAAGRGRHWRAALHRRATGRRQRRHAHHALATLPGGRRPADGRGRALRRHDRVPHGSR